VNADVRRQVEYLYLRTPSRAFRFPAVVLSASTDLIVIANRLYPARPNSIWDQAACDSGEIGVWFLYKGAAFDVGRVYTVDGEFRGYYADALELVTWDGDDPETLAPLVDLFLDMWLWPDGRVVVLDEDELRQAVTNRDVSEAQAEHARGTVASLVRDTEQGLFPPAAVRDFDMSAGELVELTREFGRPKVNSTD
jgi:hypothetical protein